MNRKRLIILLGILFLLGGVYYYYKSPKGVSTRYKKIRQEKVEAYRAAEKVRGDFTELPAAKPGEWLYTRNEPGQTVEEYKNDLRVKMNDEVNKIYLVQLGNLTKYDKELLDMMREYAEIFFQVPTVLSKEIKIERKFYDAARDQYNANALLGQLCKTSPADALSYMGILSEDMYSGDLNFVFGLASFEESAGVSSLNRFDRDPLTRKRQALKLVTHESGHNLGLAHCVFYYCNMCGINSLEEGEKYPMHLCPICLEKLEWNLGFDKKKRYTELKEFYKRNGFEVEAKFVQGQLE